VVDGEKLVVDSRNKGKHTGRNDRREDDVDGRASVIKDGGRCAGGGRCLGGRCPTIAAPADRRQAAMTAAGRLSDSFELRKRASETYISMMPCRRLLQLQLQLAFPWRS